VKVDRIIADVQDSEVELAEQLRLLAEHHAADQDLYHMGHTQARHCIERVERIEPFLDRYHADPVEADPDKPSGLLDSVRRKASQLVGHAEMSGLVALQDLRSTYVYAQLNEINWQMFIQTLEAVRDHELLDVATECHERAEMVARWLRTRLKVSTAQVYATS